MSGKTQRKRECNHPVPLHGDPCQGENQQEEYCGKTMYFKISLPILSIYLDSAEMEYVGKAVSMLSETFYQIVEGFVEFPANLPVKIMIHERTVPGEDL